MGSIPIERKGRKQDRTEDKLNFNEDPIKVSAFGESKELR